MRARPLLAALALCLPAAPEARAAKPDPPLMVRLRLLEADASRGRYRVEVRLRADVVLEEAFLVVRVVSREAGASTAGAAGPSPRATREALTLAPSRELRRELEVLTGAQEPVTLLVGLGGRVGRVQLHRTSGLDLGPERGPLPPGTVRTDSSGHSYYEVRMPAAPR